MSRFAAWLQRELFSLERPGTRGERLQLRAFELVVVVLSLRFLWEWGFFIQRIESVLFPLGLARYVDMGPLVGTGAGLVNAALASVLLLLGFLGVWRGAYLGALVGLHLQYVMRYCLGEISHGSNVVGTALLAFGLAHAAFPDARSRGRVALGLTVFFVGLGYGSAALCKLVASGPAWVQGRHLVMWIQERAVDVLSIRGAHELNALQDALIREPRLATAILSFGLLSELMGPLCWSRRLRPYAAAALVVMHLGVIATLRIHFDETTLLIVMCGFPWGAWLDRSYARAATSGVTDGA